MKPTRRTLLIALAVAFASIVGIRIISRFNASHAQTDESNQTVLIRVENVVKGEIIDQIKISGTIRPNNEVEIYAKMPGRIIALHHNVGDEVKAGDVLAVIEHQEVMLQEKASRASLAMARTNEAAARTELERAKELFAERALAQAELEGVVQKFELARAQSQAASAQADIAAQQLRNANITSLISGTVTTRRVALGANVSPAAPVFAVQDLSLLKLVTSVDAPTLLRLSKGMNANLSVDQLGEHISGKIISIAPSLDAQSRRAEIEIAIDDQNGRLVPNMFVDGSLVLSKTENVLVVPLRALVMIDGVAKLFRVNENKIEVITPKLGQRDLQNVQIIEGAHVGDMIAVSGLDRLHDGSFVTVEIAK